MNYKVHIQASEEGYAVWCPGLLGCWSQGATEAEALENMKEAITEYRAAVEKVSRGAETRVLDVG